MKEFTITITDPSRIAGITAARETYNSGLGETEEEREAHSDFLSTDQEYVQFVMDRASESYAKQYNT